MLIIDPGVFERHMPDEIVIDQQSGYAINVPAGFQQPPGWWENRELFDRIKDLREEMGITVADDFPMGEPDPTQMTEVPSPLEEFERTQAILRERDPEKAARRESAQRALVLRQQAEWDSMLAGTQQPEQNSPRKTPRKPVRRTGD